MEPVSLDTLKADPKNPRLINKQDFENLKKTLRRFGDLSGVILNKQTGQLVGGHQRVQAFKASGKNANIQVTQKFETPTPTGTVAMGYVVIDGEPFTYREVDWDLGTQRAANIAANRISGEFDKDLLAEVTYELSQLENSDELLGLTGMYDDEISRLLDQVGAGGEGDPTDDEAPPRGRCESCGQPIRGDLPVGSA